MAMRRGHHTSRVLKALGTHPVQPFSPQMLQNSTSPRMTKRPPPTSPTNPPPTSSSKTKFPNVHEEEDQD